MCKYVIPVFLECLPARRTEDPFLLLSRVETPVQLVYARLVVIAHSQERVPSAAGGTVHLVMTLTVMTFLNVQDEVVGKLLHDRALGTPELAPQVMAPPVPDRNLESGEHFWAEGAFSILGTGDIGLVDARSVMRLQVRVLDSFLAGGTDDRGVFIMSLSFDVFQEFFGKGRHLVALIALELSPKVEAAFVHVKQVQTAEHSWAPGTYS